jgi:hypothetical protein
MKRAVTMLMAVSAMLGQPLVGQTKWRVNCDVPGRKLSQIVEQARPGDVIVVQGICRERVTITTGPLILDGGGDAVLDGMGVPPAGREFNGLLTVDSARGILIRGWTVRNSPADGILGVHGASVVIEDTVIERNYTGISLSNSAAEIRDSAIRRNSAAGVDAFSNSTLILRGQIEVSGNLAGAALTLNGNTLAEIRGGHVRVNNNAGQGIIISAHSTLAIFGFQASQGTRLTTSANQGPGILIAQGNSGSPGARYHPAVSSLPRQATGVQG